MKTNVRYILVAGFGGLIVITGLLGWESVRAARRIQTESEALHVARARETRLLEDLRANILRSGIVIRDYLLDISYITAPSYREQLLALRKQSEETLVLLARDAQPESAAQLHALRRAIEEYWDSLDPVFDWTPRQRLALSYIFLRNEVLPRRRVIAELTDRIRALSEDALRMDEKRVKENSRRLQLYLARLTAAGLALGSIVAGISIWRIFHLEHLAGIYIGKIERAERELRGLSQELVHAQEEERKRISRELHDDVGQKLTALRYTLGGLSRNLEGTAKIQCEEAKQIVEHSMKTVREIAMGLRPSMLDDLGLGPAIEWLAREMSRRSGVPIEVQMEGSLRSLQDQQRTGVFRIAQEALTNCLRHAQAHFVRVLLHEGPNEFTLVVQDDGIGFEPEAVASGGLGIIGMRERAAELGGEIEWITKPGKGTQVRLSIPLTPGSVA